MEKRKGLSFNCAESVMIQVDRHHQLPDFESPCLRMASMLGGGIAGSGEVCGAICGAVLAIGLRMGTNGTESPDVFSDSREKARGVAKKYLARFEEAWGSVRCTNLLAMDKGEIPPKGTLRQENCLIQNRCDEYVSWSSREIVSLLQYATHAHS